MRSIRTLIPMAHSDLNEWPRIDQHVLSKEECLIYLRRKKAVEMYAAGEDFSAIKLATNIIEDEVRRHVKRCVVAAEDGLIFGFRALLRNTRVHQYVRTSASDRPGWKQAGYAGVLQQIFSRYPEVHELVDSLYLKLRRKGSTVHAARIEVRSIHASFCKKLRDLGVSSTQYPFNTIDCAYRSLCTYCKQLDLDASERGVRARSGEEASRRNSGGVGSGISSLIVALRPYSIVQLDYHLVDAASLFTITNEYNDILQFPIARWYIGFLVDEFSSAIVGAYVTLEVNPSADSALEVLSSALLAHPFDPDDCRSKYLEEGKCLVIQLMPELEYQCFSMLKVDRAWANSANDVVNNIIDTFGCAVNFGPSFAWWRREIIERINGELTRKGLQQMPSTYGSGVTDTKKNDPIGAAFEFQIHLPELIAVMHGAIFDYNLHRNTGLQSSTPIGVLKAALNHPASGFFHQPIPKVNQDDLKLLMHVEDSTVRGSLRKGERPYFVLDGWRYTNPTLSNCYHLIGKEITTYTNRRLAREVYATVKETGQQLGLMTPLGRNARSNLSWRDRKLIKKAGRFLSGHDNAPRTLQNSLQSLTEELTQRDKKKKSSKEALKLARLSRQQSQAEERSEEEPPELEKEKVASASPQRKHDPFGLDDIPDLGGFNRR